MYIKKWDPLDDKIPTSCLHSSWHTYNRANYSYMWQQKYSMEKLKLWIFFTTSLLQEVH